MIRLTLALALSIGISFVILFHKDDIGQEARRVLQASDFEDIVRAGDLLPSELIDRVCTTANLRVLTIGADDAMASNIEQDEAYPYLCCNGDKIAQDGLIPSGVSGCIAGLIGDKIYDVIVLDFYDTANQGLNELAKRLRNRFPDALIINMKKYYPGMVGYQHRSGWVWVYDYTSAMTDNGDMTDEALNAFENSNKAWSYKKQDEQDTAFNMATKDHLLWSLYKDTGKIHTESPTEIQDMLLRRAYLYDDWQVFNTDGHKDIARGILGLCDYNETGVVRSDNVNPWDADTDSCVV